MIIIIPLGGIGKRFKDNGYTHPKGLIKVFGKPILYYLLENIDLTNISMVYIPYNKEYQSYMFEETLYKDFPNINFKFLCLEHNTRGAAETINKSLSNLEIPDCPILSLDGDNHYKTNIIKLWNGENKVITTITDDSTPIYSYININNDNMITDIVEKNKISKYACTGAYGFSSYKQLCYYTQYILDNNIKNLDEFFISNVVKEMINDNIYFYNKTINIENWICLGTPFQLRQYYNNTPRLSCIDNNIKIKPSRFCFDLDNTLVTYPTINGDYNSVKPIEKNINFVKYLKSFGHTIIIYTARRMKTHNNNAGKSLSDIGLITFKTLEKYNIPHDEIYFGKPYADFYIDDMALNAFDNIEKLTGYYMDHIIPRSFNELIETSINTITKKSQNLKSEIYYYINIPKCIKDMFPCFFEYDKVSYKWYKMEKILGTPITILYVSELLTVNILKHVMNSINRIHNVPINDDIQSNINIYENYHNKLKLRYETYDYSVFKGSDIIYKQLKQELTNYETNEMGKLCVIHGDTVMTNIILNSSGKIKFIDMRGKLGDTNTIYGDYLYDWAKLYQSLIGYDLILQDKEVSDEYKNKLIFFFETYFIELFSHSELQLVKTITKSLLFTLLPLHDNIKCKQYYNLINDIKK